MAELSKNIADHLFGDITTNELTENAYSIKKQEFDVLLDLDGCDLIKVDNWIFKKIRKINARFQYIGQFIGQDRVMRIWTQ